ncbi:hypothetical protein EBZ39_10865 [bacterium]|nr:hypothetical protein [bacterium]
MTNVQTLIELYGLESLRSQPIQESKKNIEVNAQTYFVWRFRWIWEATASISGKLTFQPDEVNVAKTISYKTNQKTFSRDYPRDGRQPRFTNNGTSYYLDFSRYGIGPNIPPMPYGNIPTDQFARIRYNRMFITAGGEGRPTTISPPARFETFFDSVISTQGELIGELPRDQTLDFKPPAWWRGFSSYRIAAKGSQPVKTYRYYANYDVISPMSCGMDLGNGQAIRRKSGRVYPCPSFSFNIFGDNPFGLGGLTYKTSGANQSVKTQLSVAGISVPSQMNGFAPASGATASGVNVSVAWSKSGERKF